MIRHIPYNTLFLSDLGWLQSRFHFSFAEYRNPDNHNFGVLRVMNDDLIAPHSGFGRHPHRDMEIITYLLKGRLTHEDSMGNKETLIRGHVQYMSAGTGIEHSEMNDGTLPVRLIQTWIFPEAHHLAPQYGTKYFEAFERRNGWLHLAGPKDSGAAITICQDANIFVTELDSNETITFELSKERQLYLKVMEGSIMLNESPLSEGDAAEVIDEALQIRTSKPAHLMLVEMAKAN